MSYARVTKPVRVRTTRPVSSGRQQQPEDLDEVKADKAGLSLTDLTPELASTFAYGDEAKGVLITRVEAGRKISIEVPVAEIGEGKAKNVLLRAGDIISVPERLF